MLTMLSVLLILAPCVQPGTEILWAVTLEDPSTDDDRTTLLTIDDFYQTSGVTAAACQSLIRAPGFSEILCPRLNFAKVIARGPPVAPSDTSSQNLCVQYHSQSDFYSNGRSPVHDLIAFATVHSINLCGKQDPGRFYGAQDLSVPNTPNGPPGPIAHVIATLTNRSGGRDAQARRVTVCLILILARPVLAPSVLAANPDLRVSTGTTQVLGYDRLTGAWVGSAGE